MHVLVLGAGIIGTSTAWHLIERGHDVTGVDRTRIQRLRVNAGQGTLGWTHVPARARPWPP